MYTVYNRPQAVHIELRLRFCVFANKLSKVDKITSLLHVTTNHMAWETFFSRTSH